MSRSSNGVEGKTQGFIRRRSARRSADIAEISEFISHINDWARNVYHRERVADLAGLAIHGSGVLLLRTINARQSLTLAELARSLGLDASTISRQIKPLDDAELVIRTPDPEDRRNVFVSLSKEGVKALAQIDRIGHTDLSVILTDWTNTDLDLLARFLKRFRMDMLSSKVGDSGYAVRLGTPRSSRYEPR